jgi:hypothetical protein
MELYNNEQHNDAVLCRYQAKHEIHIFRNKFMDSGLMANVLRATLTSLKGKGLL